MNQIQYSFSIIHYFHHAHTHPSITKWIESKICSFPFKYYFSNPRQEKTALIPIWYTPSRLHIWSQNPPPVSPILWRLHQTYTNPAFPNVKTHAFFFPWCQLYTLLLCNIFHPQYTTCLLLSYISLHTTPSKLITIHNLHQTSISSSHHEWLGQN